MCVWGGTLRTGSSIDVFIPAMTVFGSFKALRVFSLLHCLRAFGVDAFSRVRPSSFRLAASSAAVAVAAIEGDTTTFLLIIKKNGHVCHHSGIVSAEEGAEFTVVWQHLWRHPEYAINLSFLQRVVC